MATNNKVVAGRFCVETVFGVWNFAFRKIKFLPQLRMQDGFGGLTDEHYLSNRSDLYVPEQHHARPIFLYRMGLVFYCRRNMGERMATLMDCKYCQDEVCVNADCPMRADFCPVVDVPGVCRFEERGFKNE